MAGVLLVKADQALVLDLSGLELAARKAVLRFNRLIASSCDFHGDLTLVKMLNNRSGCGVLARVELQLHIVQLLSHLCNVVLELLDRLREVLEEGLNTTRRLRA